MINLKQNWLTMGNKRLPVRATTTLNSVLKCSQKISPTNFFPHNHPKDRLKNKVKLRQWEKIMW